MSSMEIHVDIVSKEVIKPSSPTHEHHKSIKLSIFDIFSPSYYIPALFFYSKSDAPDFNPTEVSDKLKESLSKTLALFYPLAGRIKDNYVECTDEGSVYMDARVDCSLYDVLQKPDPDMLQHFLPCHIVTGEAESWPLLMVKTTTFRCGGLAIGLCFTHKFMDATSAKVFVKNWAATVRGSNDVVVPNFTASKYFPPAELPQPAPKVVRKSEKLVTKRFVFESSKIAELQTKAASSDLQHPSRVAVATALIFKCATKASRSTSGTIKPSYLSQAANVRSMLNASLLPENINGNFLLLVVSRKEEKEFDFKELVRDLRQNQQELSAFCKEKLQGGEESTGFIISRMKEYVNLFSNSGEIDSFICTSWSRLFLYECDFGWGKPAWVTNSGTSTYKNLIKIMDAKDDNGIEAWVTLTEEDMDCLEGDQELLEFASLNPSILV